MRPIDADELKSMHGMGEYCSKCDIDYIACEYDRKYALIDICQWIDNAPTIEPRKGKWIGTEFDGYADGNPVYYEWMCDTCGYTVEDEEPTWNYCPNCGADMRGDTNG